MYDSAGNKIYEGEFLRGMRHGEGTSYDSATGVVIGQGIFREDVLVTDTREPEMPEEPPAELPADQTVPPAEPPADQLEPPAEPSVDQTEPLPTDQTEPPAEGGQAPTEDAMTQQGGAG